MFSQWIGRVYQYMSVQSPSMTVTAWVLRKEALSRLTPQDQKTVLELARLAARAYSDKEVQFAADAARQLFGRGVQPNDLSPYDQEWEQLYRKTQQVFVGDAYSAETLRVAEKAAASTSL